jgi:hypothetical protein
LTIYGTYLDGKHSGGFSQAGVLIAADKNSSEYIRLISSTISGCAGDAIQIGSSQTRLYAQYSLLSQNGGWAVNATIIPSPGYAQVNLDRCGVEGNDETGGVTGSFWNSSITGCHFEGVYNQKRGPIHFDPSLGAQLIHGLLIAQNVFVMVAAYPEGPGGTLTGIAGQDAIYLNPSTESLGISVSNNEFYGKPDTIAGVYVGANVLNSSVQGNAVDGIMQIISRAPGAHASSTEFARAFWDANSAVVDRRWSSIRMALSWRQSGSPPSPMGVALPSTPVPTAICMRFSARTRASHRQ